MRDGSTNRKRALRHIAASLSVEVVTIWILALFGTILPVIVARELFDADPAWLIPGQIIVLGIFLVLTFLIERLRSLRIFTSVLIVAQVQFVADWSRIAQFLDLGITSGFWAWAGDRAVTFLLAVAFLLVLFRAGYSREDILFKRGNLSERLEPVAVPGLRTDRPWRWYALRWGSGIVLVTLVVLRVQGAEFWLTDIDTSARVVAVPVILVLAVCNAFSEEFIFRAAPLSELPDALGKQQALVVLGAVFGISHFYGTPGGLLGAGVNAFLGWFLGKSMLETRGVGFALSLHFVLDILVFTIV